MRIINFKPPNAMKKINFFLYLFITFSLVLTSCNTEEAVVTEQQDKVAIEPEFTAGFDVEEEEVEKAINSLKDGNEKSYYYCNYNFLKPSGLCKEDVDELSCGTSTTLPILLNCNKKQVGELQVSNDDEYLYLTFEAGNNRWYMNSLYLQIGDKKDIPFCSNGYPNLRKFNYRAYPYYYGGTKHAVYKIPLSKINLDTFEIVAYAKMYDSYYGNYYSSFTYDASRTQKYYYSYYYGYYYGEWVRSFEYCVQACCEPAYAYHEGCGFCSVGNNETLYTNKLAFGSLVGWNFILIDLYKGLEDCDVSKGTRIGYLKVEVEDEATGKLKVTPYVDGNHLLCGVNFFLDHDPNAEKSHSNYVEYRYDQATGTPDSFYVNWPDTSKYIYIRGGANIIQGMNPND